jgi:hypothetical protein
MGMMVVVVVVVVTVIVVGGRGGANLVGKSSLKGHLRDLRVDGKMILK